MPSIVELSVKPEGKDVEIAMESAFWEYHREE